MLQAPLRKLVVFFLHNRRLCEQRLHVIWSLKLPIISIPAIWMVPFQNVLYSSRLSKQNTSPGLGMDP